MQNRRQSLAGDLLAVTDPEQRILDRAEEEARRFGHDYIGTEHLLLALLEDEKSELAMLLGAEFQLSLGRLREAVERILGRGDYSDRAPRHANLEAEEVLDAVDLTEPMSLGSYLAGTKTVKLLLQGLDIDPDAVGQAIERSSAVRRTSPEVGDDRSEADSSGEEATYAETEIETIRLAGQEADCPRLEAVPTHLDRPAQIDGLERRGLAEILADRIRRTRGENVDGTRDGESGSRQSGSFLIHVSAPWGAGKRSLLNFIAEELESPRDDDLDRWIVVWFSSWQHQRVSPPWWWLMSAVRTQIRKKLKGRDKLRFFAKDLLWRLWNARPAVAAALVFALIATAALLTGFFGLPGSAVLKVLSVSAGLVALTTLLWQVVRGVSHWLVVGSPDAASKLLKRVHDPMEVFRRRFRNLLNAAGHPVAIFIDDLDRCRAEYVVELLEGIQTLFVRENATYVVAADRQWLCDSFASAYQEFGGSVAAPGAPLGYLFLEKTFQVSLELPEISPEVRRHYWRMLLRESGSQAMDDSDQAELRRQAEEEFAGLVSEKQIVSQLADWQGSPEEADVRRQVAARQLISREAEMELEHALQEFADLLEENPRAMKRLINAYGIERARRVRDGAIYDEEERKRSVLWMILKMRWPLLAAHLAHEPGDIKDLRHGSLPRSLAEDSDIAALFTNPRVTRVATGGEETPNSVGVTLDEETIKGYTDPGSEQPAMAIGA